MKYKQDNGIWSLWYPVVNMVKLSISIGKFNDVNFTNLSEF